MTDSNFNNVDGSFENSPKVIMRQKSDNGHCHRKELSLIEEERRSRLEFEENERLIMAGDDQNLPASSRPTKVESRIPILRPTPVKGILKDRKGQCNSSSQLSKPKQATPHLSNNIPSTAINQQHSLASRHEQSYSQCKMATTQELNQVTADKQNMSSNKTGLEYLEQTIREADEAVSGRESVSLDSSDSFRGLHCVDIDIGEPLGGMQDTNNYDGHAKAIEIDKNSQTNIYSSCANNGVTSSHDSGNLNGRKLVDGAVNETTDSPVFPLNQSRCEDVVSHPLPTKSGMITPDRSNQRDMTLATDPTLTHDIMTRSAPLELHRSTPNSLPSPISTPEYKLVTSPHSPSGYVWTSNTLPLHSSPIESPKHRPSQSGSPISPASGHQTIVYVPIVTNTCKCCHGGNPTDLRELVARRRRKSSVREDDQMSMASSIDSEVARYLVDYRSETGSNIDVLESRNSFNLAREDRIQRALLVKSNFNILLIFLLYIDCYNIDVYSARNV